ncbi:MAG: FtsW/RodA/SpoVE family cell cycle protein [Puniceicoccales bacterium]|jgi:cell division protein FtsW|nr:FtsW/RodA/SpoVE family cell cycle protein [Puniceicoccales bacterium]
MADDDQSETHAVGERGVSSGQTGNGNPFKVSAGLIVVFVAILAAIGLVVLSSAGKMTSDTYGLRGEFIIQLRWLGAAVACGFVAYLVNFEKIRFLALPFYILTSLGLIWLLIKGVETKGSARWIDLGVFKLQVSELAKVSLLFLLAQCLSVGPTVRALHAPRKFRLRSRGGKTFSWLSLNPTSGLGKFTFGFVLPSVIIGIPCILIGLAPDLGTMALCGMTGAAMLFLGGARLRYLLPTVLAGALVFAAVIYHWPARMNRVASFLDPVAMSTNEGFQLLQGKQAFAEGGMTGKGLGNGVQQRYFTPEAQTDFIFAAIGEECGFYATLGVVLLFFSFFFVVLLNLLRADDLYHIHLCFGAMLFIVLQAVINMGVVTGLLPTKGISLPFISYGGSNIVTMSIFVGVILNCMRHWARPRKTDSGYASVEWGNDIEREEGKDAP